jgi:hypothetical protein
LVNNASVLCNPIGFANTVSNSDSETLPFVTPSYDVAKTCLTDPVPAGASANFRIDLTNTGDVGLLVDVDDEILSLLLEDVELGERGGAACAEADYDLDGTDGCWSIEAGIIATGDEVYNEVTTLATIDPATLLPNEIGGFASDICEVTGGATRTRGFWQTHGPLDGYTCHVFIEHIGGSLDLGYAEFNSCAELLGGFWANNARDSDRKRRGKVCQAAVTTGKQAIAAALNSALDNGAGLPDDPENPGTDILQSWINATGQNGKPNDVARELRRLGSLLDDYNNSGDDFAIIDDDGTLIGNADPNGVRAIMDISSVDCN